MRTSKPRESEILYYQKEERKRETERERERRRGWGRERGKEGRRERENKRKLLVFMVKLSFEITTLGEVPVRAVASLGLAVPDLPLHSQRGPGIPCLSQLEFPVVYWLLCSAYGTLLAYSGPEREHLLLPTAGHPLPRSIDFWDAKGRPWHLLSLIIFSETAWVHFLHEALLGLLKFLQDNFSNPFLI